MTDQDTQQLTDFLCQQYLCESLTVKEVRTLLDYMELVNLAEGDVIADVGEVGEALYFVVRGEATLQSAGGPEGTELGRIRSGEMMGEMSFFDRQPRSVRMVARDEDTQVLKMPRTMYLRLRVEHPYIAVNLLEHAIVSLDHLFREVSTDVTSLNQYFYGYGGRR
ncbi:MAG: Crp/Fnr family transcriptional regulator [Pseudomonadota bacterium]